MQERKRSARGSGAGVPRALEAAYWNLRELFTEGVTREGLRYCSRVCCTNALKNAIRLKLFNPSCHVSVLFKNIVTYGFREEYYTEAAD